jgi:phosphoribosylamine--glycine ligase
MNVSFCEDKSACCVIVASNGYPSSYKKGFEIHLPKENANEIIYVAGAAQNEDKLVTSGGRILGAVSTAGSLKEAINNAYKLVERIKIDNTFYRKDIGQRALAASKEN